MQVRASYEFDPARDAYEHHPVEDIEPQLESDVPTTYAEASKALLSYAKECLYHILESSNQALALFQVSWASGFDQWFFPNTTLTAASHHYKKSVSHLFSDILRLENHLLCTPDLAAYDRFHKWWQTTLAHLIKAKDLEIAVYQVACGAGLDIAEGISMRERARQLNVKVASISNGSVNYCRAANLPPSDYMKSEESRHEYSKAQLALSHTDE